MQTLPVALQNALESSSRTPTIDVSLIRSYDSIPFAGKIIQPTVTDEKFIKHIIHTTGCICLVYVKKSDTSPFNYDLYYKRSNTDQTAWEEPVLVAASGIGVTYTTPTAVQIGDAIGIVVDRGGTLYKVVVDIDGTVVSALASLSITGITPSLTKIGSTYWLAYAASNIIYARTSADLITWSAATNMNTVTGLTNAHNFPYFYYDLSNKFWMVFQRVSDATVSPVVTNVYYINSTNAGVSWSSPVAMTAYTAGTNSAYRPTIVDIGAERYYAYTVEQQVRTIERVSGRQLEGINGALYDEDSDEFIFLERRTVGSYVHTCIIFYNKTTEVEQVINPFAADSSNRLYNSFHYDFVNKIVVMGASDSSSKGIVVYNKLTTATTVYSTTSTPAIPETNRVSDVAIYANQVYVYYFFSNNIFYNINLTTNTVSTVWDTADTTSGASGYSFVTNQYLVVILNRGNQLKIGVHDKTTLAQIYNQTITKTNYQFATSKLTSYEYKPAVDLENNVFYIPANRNANLELYHETGIVKYTIGSASVSETAYYNNLPGNAYSLLPAPYLRSVGAGASEHTPFNVVYKSDRLYILAQIYSGNNAGLGMYVTTFNTVSEAAMFYHSTSGATAYADNFPSIDAATIKIIPNFPTPWAAVGYAPSVTPEQELVFINGNPSTPKAYIQILIPEGDAFRVQYRKTSDDATWSAALNLIDGLQNDYCQIGFSGSALMAVWHLNLDGVFNLRWDTDVSSADLTSFVSSIEISKDMDSATSAQIVLADLTGRFDPLNYSSLNYDWLEENNIISIERGYNGSNLPAFYGYITSGHTARKRGNEVTYSLNLLDRSKFYLIRKITTGFYEGQTVGNILISILTTYMGLTSADYEIPTITDIIPTVQFIEEYPMDILKKLLQPYFYYPFFDESGKLIVKSLNYDAVTDFTYYKDGTDTPSAVKASAKNLSVLDYLWTDTDLVNKVIVVGETAAPVEQVFDEEYMGAIQGTAGWFTSKNTFVFYFSADKTLKCVNPRIKVVDRVGNRFFGGGERLNITSSAKQTNVVIQQNLTNFVILLYSLIAIAAATIWLVNIAKSGVIYNPLGYVVMLLITIIGQISNFYYEIYASPVGDAVPETITAIAEDTDLQARYGVVEKEIDNPFLATYGDCLALAIKELERSKWFRYMSELEILHNPALQTGDVIVYYNEVTGLSYKIYIVSISENYSRGTDSLTKITGAMVI